MSNADKITDAAVGAMTDIATALKTMAPEVWSAAVRQQIVSGTIGLAVAALLLIVASMSFALGVGLFRKDDPDCTGFWVIAGILSVIAIITITCCLPMVLNPQWGAIKDIAGLVKR